ncbi:hypothetical protein L208DRAFT_1360691 [Tricholoma matsutake]|nr:hypothetical protein L208DRAFT_1360691 [Tricholoma matsutake 945]
MPWCDLLVWILIVKLVPSYYRKLERLLTDTGRYRELPSWRKQFKRNWKKLLKTPITMPINEAYRPDVKRWVCTCPAMVLNRFLLCKHLVQAVQPVSPLFFLEVRRQRTAPIWSHPLLKPPGEDLSAPQNVAEIAKTAPGADGGEREDGDDDVDNSDDDDDDDVQDFQEALREGLTFEEAMSENIKTIGDFLEGLKYQVQFRDHRMLQVLEREGGSLLRLAKTCLGKERQMRTTRGSSPTTWQPETSTAMFYRSRPTGSDENT